MTIYCHIAIKKSSGKRVKKGDKYELHFGIFVKKLEVRKLRRFIFLCMNVTLLFHGSILAFYTKKVNIMSMKLTK